MREDKPCSGLREQSVLRGALQHLGGMGWVPLPKTDRQMILYLTDGDATYLGKEKEIWPVGNSVAACTVLFRKSMWGWRIGGAIYKGGGRRLHDSGGSHRFRSTIRCIGE